MGFDVLCESCGKRLSIPAPLFERKVQGRVVTIACKTCQAPIRIDATVPPPPAAEPVPSSDGTDAQWSTLEIPRAARLPIGEGRESETALPDSASTSREGAPADPEWEPLPEPKVERSGERKNDQQGVAEVMPEPAKEPEPEWESEWEAQPPSSVGPPPSEGRWNAGAISDEVSDGRGISAAPPDYEELENSSEVDAGWDEVPPPSSSGVPIELSGASADSTLLDAPYAAAVHAAPLGSFVHEDGPISVRAPIATIGRYALFERFATGGMATVHLGRLDGAGGFSRVVAIKRLLPHLLQNTEFAEMLLNEARLAARVRHPNVVPTLDVVASRGDVLIVLEYVHGEALSALRRKQSRLGGAIPIEIATRLMLDVLEGLHAVHGATDEKGRSLGLVHRDVSPQNVIVGVDGIARVLDFGIVKALERMEETLPNKLKGKTGYMSPEHIRGERVTRRSDVFSAGIVLWELLTLHRFSGAATDRERMDFVLAGRYPKPSQHRADLAAPLEEVVMRALAFEAEDRFASARDFADALAQASDLASVGSVEDWVKTLAEDTLMERERLVAQVENWKAGAPEMELSSGPFAAELSVLEIEQGNREKSSEAPRDAALSADQPVEKKPSEPKLLPSAAPRTALSMPSRSVWEDVHSRDAGLSRPMMIFLIGSALVLSYFMMR